MAIDGEKKDKRDRRNKRIKIQAIALAVLIIIYFALAYYFAPPGRHTSAQSISEITHDAFERGEKAVKESDYKQAPPGE